MSPEGAELPDLAIGQQRTTINNIREVTLRRLNFVNRSTWYC